MALTEYLKRPEHYFWQIDDDDKTQVFTMPNGPTIAYTDYFFEILSDLETNKLPRCGSLLLVMFALNKIRYDGSILGLAAATQYVGNATIKDVQVFLMKLEKLPDKYKYSKSPIIFNLLFSIAEKYNSSFKKELVIDQYKNDRFINKDNLLAQLLTDNEIGEIWQADLAPLVYLNNHFPTTESIIEELSAIKKIEVTDDAVAPIIDESDKNISKGKESFIDMLEDNVNTFQIGSLIKRIWSSLNIPYHANSPSSQPIGGISDISNKGDFTKLLLSEFANDDDVFISRIANSEALYVQREVPPQDSKHTRYFLIDNSIKCWGTPRIVQMAIGIAIANHPKATFNSKFYFIGDKEQSINLSTVDEIITSMNNLSLAKDGTNGLINVMEKENILPKDEVFVLTSENAYFDTDLKNAINLLRDKISYFIPVDNYGNMKVYSYKNKTKREIQATSLPINDLWNQKKKQTVQNLKPIQEENLPMLLAVPRHYKNNCVVQENEDIQSLKFYQYHKGHLYEYQRPHFMKGMLKINLDLEKAYFFFELAKTLNGHLCLLFNDNEKKSVGIYDVVDKKCEWIQLSKDFSVSGMESFLQSLRTAINLTSHGKICNLQEAHVIEIMNSTTLEKSQHLIKELEYFNKNQSKANNLTIHYILSKVQIFDSSELILNERYQLKPYRLENINNFNIIEQKIQGIQKVNLLLKRQGDKNKLIANLSKACKISINEAQSIIVKSNILLADVKQEYANEVKNKIEIDGAVCYIDNLYMEFEDGSKISISDSLLKFESSNKNIPLFYVTFLTKSKIAMASETEFSGDEYFYWEEKKLEIIPELDFFEKYIKPFIKNIVDAY
jgi:hypothetical protein